MELCDIKNNYPEMMGIELVEGENPWNNSTLTSTDCLINEQAVKAIGLKNPVGKQIGLYQRNQPYTIRGILKDANTKSLHRKVDPQVFLKMENPKEWQVMLIKTGENTQQALKIIEKTWKSHNPDIPFEYHFLDQVYENLYRNEKTANQIVTIGMFVAIFLAFMGLFAIAHYATLRRVKEVGVRKVNGAKNIEIIALLNRDFIVWVIIAFVVATPVSVLAMQKWMANFAYKTNLSWWIFLLSGIVSVVIAVFTVSWQSIKAANHNPVESLRYE
jgi:putative ABC transport system permease protein